MILYNETINIDTEVKDEWLEWIKSVHLPKVMATKAFTSFKLFKLLSEEENNGSTYCIQYFANNMWDVEDYLENYSNGLQADHYKKFKDKFVIFSTFLEGVE
jgi:hypothetical protein